VLLREFLELREFLDSSLRQAASQVAIKIATGTAAVPLPVLYSRSLPVTAVCAIVGSDPIWHNMFYVERFLSGEAFVANVG
jgi:hypothetical protein